MSSAVDRGDASDSVLARTLWTAASVRWRRLDCGWRATLLGATIFVAHLLAQAV